MGDIGEVCRIMEDAGRPLDKVRHERLPLADYLVNCFGSRKPDAWRLNKAMTLEWHGGKIWR